MEGRKIGDQERLTCQNRKVKIRNVANNYEKSMFFEKNSSGEVSDGDQIWSEEKQKWSVEM